MNEKHINKSWENTFNPNTFAGKQPPRWSEPVQRVKAKSWPYVQPAAETPMEWQQEATSPVAEPSTLDLSGLTSQGQEQTQPSVLETGGEFTVSSEPEYDVELEEAIREYAGGDNRKIKALRKRCAIDATLRESLRSPSKHTLTRPGPAFMS